MLLAILSRSPCERDAEVPSMRGSKVEERWRGRAYDAAAALLVFGSAGMAAAVAKSPPPVKPAFEGDAASGSSVDDRCRDARGGRVG